MLHLNEKRSDQGAVSSFDPELVLKQLHEHIAEWLDENHRYISLTVTVHASKPSIVRFVPVAGRPITSIVKDHLYAFMHQSFQHDQKMPCGVEFATIRRLSAIENGHEDVWELHVGQKNKRENHRFTS